MCVFLCRVFNVERLRLGPNVFDPVSGAYHNLSPQVSGDALLHGRAKVFVHGEFQSCVLHRFRRGQVQETSGVGWSNGR